MNNKTIYAFALACVLAPTVALAQGNSNGPGQGDGSCVGNCPQSGGSGSEQTTTVDVSQGQQQGQLQGQSQESTNINLNDNQSSATAGAVSGSQSDSNAIAVGGASSAFVGVGVETGPTVSGSSSSAQGGDGGNSESYASGGAGGDSSSESQVGNVTSASGDSVSNSGAHTGDVGVSINDNSSYVIDYDYAAAGAASVYAQVCQSGGSAQAKAGGFSVVNSEPLCEHLKMAAVMREAYVWEMNHGEIVCQEPMEGEAIGVQDDYTDICFPKYAQDYLDSYREHLRDAMALMDKTEEAGLIDKMSGYMVRPLAIIGALIWLL